MKTQTFITAFALTIALAFAAVADARVVKNRPQFPRQPQQVMQPRYCAPPQPISYISGYTIATVVPVTVYQEYSVQYTAPCAPTTAAYYDPTPAQYYYAPTTSCNALPYTARGCVTNLLRCPFRLLNGVECILFGE